MLHMSEKVQLDPRVLLLSITQLKCDPVCNYHSCVTPLDLIPDCRHTWIMLLYCFTLLVNKTVHVLDKSASFFSDLVILFRQLGAKSCKHSWNSITLWVHMANVLANGRLFAHPAEQH